jgi:hypothetical protein
LGGLLTFPPLGLLLRAFDAVRNRRQLQRVRGATADIGFPLDRRMRILIWRERRAHAPERLGAMARDDVVAARLPFVGGASWRFVQLRLRAGYLISFQVEATLADQFVAHLSTTTAPPRA